MPVATSRMLSRLAILSSRTAKSSFTVAVKTSVVRFKTQCNDTKTNGKIRVVIALVFDHNTNVVVSVRIANSYILALFYELAKEILWPLVTIKDGR
jgi:hypothetical protein